MLEKDLKTGLTQLEAELLEEEKAMASSELDIPQVAEDFVEETPERLEFDNEYHEMLVARLVELGLTTVKKVEIGETGEFTNMYLFNEDLTNEKYMEIEKEIVSEIGLFDLDSNERVPFAETLSTGSLPTWTGGAYTYKGELPQLYRYTADSSTKTIPLFDNIFTNMPSKTVLRRNENFTIITLASGVSTDNGTKEYRHQIECCGPSGGMVKKFLRRHDDTISQKILPWVNHRLGVCHFASGWRCMYRVNYSTNGGLPVYNGSANQIGERAANGKYVLAQNGASTGATYRNWIRIVGHQGNNGTGGVNTPDGRIYAPANDYNARNAWFVSTGIESKPQNPFVTGRW